MRRIWLALSISTLLVATFTGPVLAGTEVPFQAASERVWAGPLGPNPSCPEGYVGEDSMSIGTATHLGKFEMFETLCLDFRTPPVASFEVYGELVAANGDSLLFAVEGTFNLATPEMTSSGWVFTGGTGRFASASGQADETLIRDSAGTLVGVTAIGTISYDASDRAD